MISLLPKDLQHVIADKLDEISLLNLTQTMSLKITQNYWKERVKQLPCVKRLSEWQVGDWRKTLADVTYLNDYHQLTYVVAALQDFLKREFSVWFLSQVHLLDSYGYFNLLEELKVFLKPHPETICYQHGDEKKCLCEYHGYLNRQKNFFQGYIQRYKNKEYFVHYTEGWLSFLKYINTNNFYYQIALDSYGFSASKRISFVDSTNGKYRITYFE